MDCVLNKTNTRRILNGTRIAVENTTSAAEERHAHRKEMESMRRDARAACEANLSLQGLVLRLQQGQDTDADSDVDTDTDSGADSDADSDANDNAVLNYASQGKGERRQGK